MPEHSDPFREARVESGVLDAQFDGEQIPLILGLQDVRKAAKDWETFSSDKPFKIVPHSEEAVRSVRQLPIETDPPDHTDYRQLVQPLFRRPTQKDYQEDIKLLIDGMLRAAIAQGDVEIVREFALPLQCRALTRLLKMPESEAEVWIGWGIHVFNEAGLEAETVDLDRYILEQLEQARLAPGEDLFSLLNQLVFRGRALSAEEKCGFANLAFAGGRDTIINTVSSILVYLAEHPEALPFLREDPARIMTATEEFVRYVSPLTAIARTCPHATNVGDVDVAAGGRVGLCWPSANRDERIFVDADTVQLDRRPNPHVGFGFGPHNCMGAPHARVIIRSLLQALCEQVGAMELVSSEPRQEVETSYTRKAGYDSAVVRFTPR